MLQKANNTQERWRGEEPVSREQAAEPSLRGLIDRLTGLGFDLPAFCGQRNDVAGGVPLQLSARDLSGGKASAGAIDTVLDLLQQRVPLTLSLVNLGRDEAAMRKLQRFCETLQAAIASRHLPGDYVGLCMSSQQLPLAAFQVLARTVRGNGPRYVLLERPQMTQQRSSAVRMDADRTWSFLWQQRLAPQRLIAAYGATVRTACPLLADEVATSVLPLSGALVPPDSAWLPLHLSLPAFASASGQVRWERLLPVLAEGVALAEVVLDMLQWPQSVQRADAYMNRRLALSIDGLGELLMRHGSDPRDLASLTWLCDILARIRRTLWHRSGQLARSNGCLGALCDADPASGWIDHARRDDWRRRWRSAVEKSGVRHRNILVLSPYSVLPAGASANDGYADLLPVIAYADSWSFCGAPDFRDWSLNDYTAFHRRAWAVIAQPKTASVIAAGV